MTSNLPLEGVTVVSLEHAIAAPLATRHLADMGARVIKIERPGVGDFARSYDQRANGLCSHFVWVNRSKQSLTLDLKKPEAQDVLHKILQEADVLVQNLAPGATAKMGLDFESLAPKFPQLIVCDISGYGEGGPYTSKKAYDLLIQSECGYLSVTGTPDEVVKSGISIADISAGMYAYSNILAALLQRHKTGKGRRIEVAMIDTMTEWMGFPMYYAMNGQPAPPRTGSAHATIFPYGPFQAGDGKTVMLGLQNEREWTAFCQNVLRCPQLIEDPRFIDSTQRNVNRESLRIIIEGEFKNITATELINRLENADIANAYVNDIADLWAHPQLKARNRWTQVSSSVGQLAALIPPGFDQDHPANIQPIPQLGEHTDSIVREFGFDVTKLREAGAI